MTTSGSYNFIQNRNQLILDAFQLIGQYGIMKTVAPEDMTFAASTLNKMIKVWSTQGLHLWEKGEANIFLTPSVALYKLGNNTGDAHWCDANLSNITQLTNNQTIGNTSITVNNTVGMLVNDNIGIVLDGLLIQWTTILSIVGNIITLTNPLTNPASANNIIYSYTNNLYKPLRITSCRRLTGVDTGINSSVVEVWMKEMSYSEYFNMASKTINGTPSAYMYDPQVSDGNLYIWQRPADPSVRLQVSYERLIQDLDQLTDTFDFPAEWLEPITYQLAVRMAPAYGKEDKVLKIILPLASQMLEELKNWDNEITSVKIQPDNGWVD